MKTTLKRPLVSLIGIAVIGAAIIIGLGGCNTLQSIEITKEPARLVYGQGQDLDRSGLAVMAHYKKNSEEVPNPSSLQISGYDRGKPGEQTVTVTMEKKGVFSTTKQSATFTVTVVPVEKISIQQPPAKTVYMQGDEFDSAGLVAWVEFEKGTVPGETIRPAQLRFSGYNKEKEGNQTVTVDYYGKQASFEVRAAPITKIVVTNPPDNTDYFTGEDIVLAGLVVTGTWEGAGEKRVNITQGNLSSFDKNRAGKQDVFVTYLGKTASFPVTFVAMQSIAVSKPPEKLNYENGEKLELDGLMVQGTRMGATSIEMVDVSRLKISGYDRFKGGNQTITVTLGGKTASFRVTVAPNPFVGTWRTTWYHTNDKEKTKPRQITLIMTEDSWKLTAEKTEYYSFETVVSGTYTRDSDSGKHATLVVTNSTGGSGTPPDAVDVLSLTEINLTGGWVGQARLNR